MNKFAFLRFTLTAFLFSVVVVSGEEPDSTPSKPTIENSPNSVHVDWKDGIPIFASGFPSYTEIKDPKTDRIWVVQPDGTLNEKTQTAHQKINKETAIAMAKSLVHEWKTPSSVKSASLVQEPHWGEVWIVETDAQQPTPPKPFQQTSLLSLITRATQQIRITPDLQNSAFVAYKKEGSPGELSLGWPIPGKRGFCISPNAPYGNLVDVRLFEPGEIILCPYTYLPFIVPKLPDNP